MGRSVASYPAPNEKKLPCVGEKCQGATDIYQQLGFTGLCWRLTSDLTKNLELGQEKGRLIVPSSALRWEDEKKSISSNCTVARDCLFLSS